MKRGLRRLLAQARAELRKGEGHVLRGYRLSRMGEVRPRFTVTHEPHSVARDARHATPPAPGPNRGGVGRC